MSEMYESGCRLEREGDLQAAEAAYRSGDTGGCGESASALGRLLAKRGALDEAEAAFRRSWERDSVWGAYNLGILLERDRVDLRGAIDAWSWGDERGHAPSSFNLGCSLREQRDLAGAERAWRRGSEGGDGGSAFNLGMLLDQRGDLEGAEASWRWGSELGDGPCAASYGRILEERGDAIGAEDQFRRSDELGDANGAFNLGALLWDQGDPEGGISAMRRAVERGHPGAGQLVEKLESERGSGAVPAFLDAQEQLWVGMVTEANELWERVRSTVAVKRDIAARERVLRDEQKNYRKRVAALERQFPWTSAAEPRPAAPVSSGSLVESAGQGWALRGDFRRRLDGALDAWTRNAEQADARFFRSGQFKRAALDSASAAHLGLSALGRAIADAERELAAQNALLAEIQGDLPRRRQSLGELSEAVRRAQGRLPAASRPWGDECWGSLAVGGGITLIRAGELIPQADTELGSQWSLLSGFTVPLTVEAMESLHLVGSASSRPRAQGLARSLLLRTLSCMPPGSVRLSVFDPSGLGQSVAPLLELAEYDRSLLGGQVWTSRPDLQRVLAEQSAHIEQVIQRYLRDKYDSIDQFNAEAGEIAEPYRLVCVFDFPEAFDEASFAELRRIAESGRRCGVVLLLVSNSDVPLPHGVALDALPVELRTLRIDSVFRQQVERQELLFDLLCETDEQAPRDVVSSIVDQVGRGARTGASEPVGFDRSFALFNDAALAGRKRGLPALPSRVELRDPATWWPLDAVTSLAAPVGLTGARDVAVLGLDSSDHSGVLMVGRPGSGKSTLLHAFIGGLTTLYGPEELELHLIDFKDGVEFKAYAAQALPHARSVAVESDREFGLSVLESLSAELTWRGALMRETSDAHASFDTLRSKTATKLPRIVLVFDEFQVLFAQNDKLGAKAADLLESLIRQGRGLGIHVVLGSQSLSGLDALGSHVPQLLPVRILLAASESDQLRVLGEGNTEGAQLSRAGEGILNAAAGQAGANERFRGAVDDPQERLERLRDLRRRADGAGFLRRPVVFEGNAPISIEETQPRAFAEAVRASAARTVRLRTGVPMAISGDADIELRREAGANVLLVARDEVMSRGGLDPRFSLPRAVITNAVLSAVTAGADVRVADFTPIDEGFEEGLAPLAESGALVVERRRRVPALVQEIHAEVARRLEAEDLRARGIVVVLFGMHRARDFDSESIEFDAEADLQRLLGEILRDGPEVGVHTIMWFETVGAISRRLRHDAVRECSWRLGGRMSGDDSQSFLGADGAASLRPQQLLTANEDLGLLRRSTALTAPGRSWMEDLAGEREEA